MAMLLLFRRAGAIVSAAVALLALAACSSGGSSTKTTTTASGPCSSTGSTTWTAAEVENATGLYKVNPVYAVPKGLHNCTLAFINPGESVPFFKTWSVAMHAAAQLYGVNLVEEDVNLQFQNELADYDQMKIRRPDALGVYTLPGNTALLEATKTAKIPLITVDSSLAGDPYSLGVPNTTVGTMAGQMLAAAAQQKLSGAWKGKTLVYVGLSGSNCPPCDERINSGLAAARKTLSLPASDVVISENNNGGVTQAQTNMTNILTAHPNDVFIIVPLNDEGGTGALQALATAHRLNDALEVSLGADKLGRTALRNPVYASTLLGAVDFNPYSEGWNWIAAAIATVRGQSYQPYAVDTMLTPANVNTYYPLPDNKA